LLGATSETKVATKGETMKQAENTAIYRICAVTDERWDVLRGSSLEPVATFNDKHAALACAMSLARCGSGWHLPPGRRHDALRTMFNQPRGTRGTGL
jgi:hypothetical protein